MANNAISGLSPKQKVIAIVFVIILLLVIWQVTSLFTGDASPSPPPQDKIVSKAGPPAGGPGGQSTPASVAAQNLTPRPQPVSDRFLPENNKESIKEQQAATQNYLEKVDKLQVLNVERQIAETNQAIAAANLATATADKNMSNLLTAPSMSSSADYGNKLSSPNNTEQQNPNVVASQPGTNRPALDYTVVSVSMQLDKWNAILGYQGKLYSVIIGDKLPEDGSVVTAIDNSSVTLTLNKKSRKINIISTI